MIDWSKGQVDKWVGAWSSFVVSRYWIRRIWILGIGCYAKWIQRSLVDIAWIWPKKMLRIRNVVVWRADCQQVVVESKRSFYSRRRKRVFGCLPGSEVVLACGAVPVCERSTRWPDSRNEWGCCEQGSGECSQCERIDKRARKENDMESLIYTGIINHVLESGSYT